MGSFLVVDEDETFRTDVSLFFSGIGHSIDRAPNFQSAIAWLEIHDYEVVISNVQVPGGDVHRLIRTVKKKNKRTIVIVLATLKDTQEGLLAVKNGAFSMLQAPFSLPELNFQIRRGLDHREETGLRSTARVQETEPYKPYNFIGESDEIQRVLRLVDRVARTNARVIVIGETGTGKELVAGAIHYNSLRSDGPFVRVNCAALPEQLLESELFGYEQGAFTGADRARIGRFEHANGGTIFLDEVADMSLFTQAKVLRVIQENEFERIGSNETRKVDVRIVSATNKDLLELITKGEFREDLFFRLNVISIRLPPLRTRTGDIELLANFFLDRASKEMNKRIKGIGPQAMKVLNDYDWPGNIRELENTIERAVLLAEGDMLAADDLELLFAGRSLCSSAGRGITLPEEGISLGEAERQLILQALERSRWVQKDAAALLQISSRTLNYKVKNYGITHPSWKRNK